MTINEYIRYRFKVNNHNKYHKYMEEWAENLTPEQIAYFIEERNRLLLN